MHRRCRNDDGVSLIEMLVAVMIMGTAVITLVTGMSGIVNSAGQTRQDTTAAFVVRDYAEAVEQAATATGAWCSASYTVSYTPPTGYSVTPSYGSCPANNSTTPQFQTVTLSATAPGGDVEHLTFVVRKP